MMLLGTLDYDSDDELTSIKYARSNGVPIGSLKYGYDKDGRRTSMGGTLASLNLPAVVSSASYDAANQLTNWNGEALAYDGNGNLLSGLGNTYGWNSRDQLISNNGAALAYDALGRRVSGAGHQTLYDGWNPVLQDSNTFLLSGPGLDSAFEQTNSSGTLALLKDGTNSTLMLSNDTASTVGQYSYSPYGSTSATGTASTAFQYTGRENDGTGGLYDYRNRYYMPQIGRFISRDPIGLAGGMNEYGYVGGNPISFRDPNGLCLEDLCVVEALLVYGFLVENSATIGMGTVVAAELATGTMTPLSGPIAIAERATTVYTLRAVESGFYPVMQRDCPKAIANIWLNAKDIWKYGITVSPATRYNAKWLKSKGEGLYLNEEVIASNRLPATLIEKLSIIKYVEKYGTTPPGNKGYN